MINYYSVVRTSLSIKKYRCRYALYLVLPPLFSKYIPCLLNQIVLIMCLCYLQLRMTYYCKSSLKTHFVVHYCCFSPQGQVLSTYIDSAYIFDSVTFINLFIHARRIKVQLVCPLRKLLEI